MRPPGPLPSTCVMSTPSSRAVRRVDGAAGTRPPPLGNGRAGADAAAAGRAGAPRPMSTTFDGVMSRVFARRRLGARQILVLGGGRIGRLLGLPRALGLAPRPCRVLGSGGWPERGAALVHGQHHLPDLHLVARLDLEFLDDAGDAGGHLDRRLVGLELEDRLVLLQRVARLHQQAHDVAAGDTLTKFRNDEVSHVSPSLL